jgi:hypothetical protein
MMKGPPPRLHVLLRAESPTALVLRQGPSRTFCAIAWNLAKDRFEVGQWVKHKIYPERGDISPDGKWHLYFALNGRWKSETKGSWTGLARVPYFKCVKMWPQGDTWGGGGAIERVNQLGPAFLHVEHTPPLPKQFRVTGDTLQRRLQRDGWIHGEKHFGSWRLKKRTPNMGFVQKHQLIGEETHDRSTWQWADIDSARKRLVFAEAGRICSVPLAKPLAEPKILFDANDMAFEQVVAPY